MASDGRTVDGDTGSGEETSEGHVRRDRTDRTAVSDLTRTIEQQRAHVLVMEDTLRKYDKFHAELRTVQDDLIRGRVNDARIRLSNVLLKWP